MPQNADLEAEKVSAPEAVATKVMKDASRCCSSCTSAIRFDSVAPSSARPASTATKPFGSAEKGERLSPQRCHRADRRRHWRYLRCNAYPDRDVNQSPYKAPR